MLTVGARQMKSDLATLLKRVDQGESFMVTRNGVPMARLIPVREPARPRVQETIAGLVALHEEVQGRALTAQEIRALVHDGHGG